MTVQEQLKQIRDSVALVAFAGCLGAVGPSLSKIAALSQGEGFKMPHGNFWFGVVFYGILGVALVLIGKEKVAWKALLQGMGAPAFFSSAGNVAITIVGMISVSGIAYAEIHQIAPLPTSSKVDSVNLLIVVENGDTLEVICGNNIYRVSDSSHIKIPYMKQIVIRDHGSKTVFNIPEKDSVIIKAEVKERKGLRHLLEGFFPIQREMVQKIAPRNIHVEEQQLQEE